MVPDNNSENKTQLLSKEPQRKQMGEIMFSLQLWSAVPCQLKADSEGHQPLSNLKKIFGGILSLRWKLRQFRILRK
jgi:hypothetical protein